MLALKLERVDTFMAMENLRHAAQTDAEHAEYRPIPSRVKRIQYLGHLLTN